MTLCGYGGSGFQPQFPRRLMDRGWNAAPTKEKIDFFERLRPGVRFTRLSLQRTTGMPPFYDPTI
jgi:hypothetical protein